MRNQHISLNAASVSQPSQLRLTLVFFTMMSAVVHSLVMNPLHRHASAIRRVSRRRPNTCAMLLSSKASTDDDDNQGGGSVEPLKKVLRFRGPVDEGYGRGGKKLGVPTANLPNRFFQNALEEVPAGVYLGWAVIEGENKSDAQVKVPRNVPNKAVVNVGFAPTFEGQEQPEKMIEAHLITTPSSSDESKDEDTESEPTFDDFYGVPLRLQLTGFLRPEQKFDSFPALLAQIHSDIETARNTLDTEPYGKPFIQDSFLQDSSDAWLGSNGGDKEASWEFEPFEDVLKSLK